MNNVPFFSPPPRRPMQRDSTSTSAVNANSGLNSNANDPNDDEKNSDDDDSEKEISRQPDNDHGGGGGGGGEDDNADDQDSDTQSSSDSFPIPTDLDTQEQVQQLIREVNRNPNLSQARKGRILQRIHSQRFTKRRKLDTAKFVSEVNRDAHGKTYSDIYDGDELLLGCEHYARKCRIRAECCGAWVVCRHCHDHNPSMCHTMDRFATKLVRCMLCEDDEGQPVAEKCRKCGVKFARYFCDKCKFYDDHPKKDIYHCDDCKICRIGKGLGTDNYHCKNCDACVSLKYLKEHRCLKKSLDANCPICGQYIKTSTKPVVFMQCSHTMHAHCFDEYTTKYYHCPLCHKSLTDMSTYYAEIRRALAQEVLPTELKNRAAIVLCHDCDKRCATDYHYMHLMCQRCKGFNTTMIRWYEKTGSSEVFTTEVAKEPSKDDTTTQANEAQKMLVEEKKDQMKLKTSEEISIAAQSSCEIVVQTMGAGPSSSIKEDEIVKCERIEQKGTPSSKNPVNSSSSSSSSSTISLQEILRAKTRERTNQLTIMRRLLQQSKTCMPSDDKGGSDEGQKHDVAAHGDGAQGDDAQDDNVQSNIEQGHNPQGNNAQGSIAQGSNIQGNSAQGDVAEGDTGKDVETQ